MFSSFLISTIVFTAKIIFKDNWEENVWGEMLLIAGWQVDIVYEAARLPNRDMNNNARAWDIYAEFKFSQNGNVSHKKLDGPKIINGKEIMTTKINIPLTANTLVIWFKNVGVKSGVTYDSDYGSNYVFKMTTPIIPIIGFDSNFYERLMGKLLRGGQFYILYDSKRLHGNTNITAGVKFSAQGAVISKNLAGPLGSTTMHVANIKIPADAKEVILWFYHLSNSDGNYIYDSDYGKNYKFTLSG